MAGPISFGYQVLGFGSGKKPASGGGGGATTTKVTVTQYDDVGDGTCNCSSTSNTFIVQNSSTAEGGDPIGIGSGGSDLNLAVNDWISIYDDSYSPICGKVTAINSTGTTTAISIAEYSDCKTCQTDELSCMEEEGEGGGYCLLPYMLVKLIDNSLIEVANLQIGDLIEGPDGFTEVRELIKEHKRNSYLIIEDELHISSDHPILIGSKMIKAKDYSGMSRIVRKEVDTVYVGTTDPLFNVYCKNNVYSVDGQYKDNKN